MKANYIGKRLIKNKTKNNSKCDEYDDEIWEDSMSQSIASSVKQLESYPPDNEKELTDTQSNSILGADEVDKAILKSSSTLNHIDTSNHIPTENVIQFVGKRLTKKLSSPNKKVKINNNTQDSDDDDIIWNDDIIPITKSPYLENATNTNNTSTNNITLDVMKSVVEGDHIHILQYLELYWKKSQKSLHHSGLHSLDSIFLFVIESSDKIKINLPFIELLLLFQLDDPEYTRLLISSYLKNHSKDNNTYSLVTNNSSNSESNTNNKISVLPNITLIDTLARNNRLLNFLWDLRSTKTYEDFLKFRKRKTNRDLDFDYLFQPLMKAFINSNYIQIKLFSKLTPNYILYFFHFRNIDLELYQSSIQNTTSGNNNVNSNNDSYENINEPSSKLYNKLPYISFQLIQNNLFLPFIVSLIYIDKTLLTLRSSNSNVSNSRSTINNSSQQNINNNFSTSGHTITTSLATTIINQTNIDEEEIDIDILFSAGYILSTQDTLDVLRLPDKSDKSTIAHWVCESNNHLCLSYLLQLDPVLITLTDQSGLTILHSASMMGSNECIDIILDTNQTRSTTTYATSNINLNNTGYKRLVSLMDDEGWTPFLYAIYRSQVTSALKLLKKQPLPNDSFNFSDYENSTDMKTLSSPLRTKKAKIIPTSTPQSLLLNDIYDFEEAVYQLKVSVLQFMSFLLIKPFLV